MSKITFDDLTLWWYSPERRPKTWGAFAWFMLPWLLIMATGLLMHLLKVPLLLVGIVMAVCGPWMAWNVTRLMLADRHDNRFWEELRRRADEVPVGKLCLALKLYDRDWQITAVECEEVHLSGECPLCGAA